MEDNLLQNNLPPEKPTLWEANPKLKTLLLVLIFVFLFSGIGLVVFAQWQNQYRQKIYDDTQASLPKHQPSAPSLKSFASQTGAIQFQYPSNLTVAEADGIVTVNHNIPYENHGDCDMKGDSRTYPTLNDFNVAIQIVNKSVAQSVKQFSPYMPPENFSGESLKISPGFIDQAEIGQYKGYAILEGVEGCGHIIYYFPIANNQTLVVIKDNVQMLSNIVVPEVRNAILKVPGVITPEQSDVIFKQIIGSLKLSSTSSQNDVSGWKTYTNTKYNFTFNYPVSFVLEDKGGWQMPDGNGGNLDLYKIDLIQDTSTSLTILMNIPSAGCGEIAENIGGKTLLVNGVIINKSINKRTDANSRCIIYSGFDKGIYMVASMNQSNVTEETIFDAIISTFKFTK